jgi:hypothetical protein
MLKVKEESTMILYAKRLIDENRRAFEQVIKDQWLEYKRLTDSVSKTWISIAEISPESSVTRVSYGDKKVLVDRQVYIEEPTYVVVSQNSQYTDLFSLSKSSLSLCSEIMRKCGGAQEAGTPAFADFNNNSIVERTSVFDPKQKAYIQTIYDDPPNKGAILRTSAGQGVEVEGFVLKSKEGIISGQIKLVSVGVSEDRWELYIVHSKMGDTVQVNAESEFTWVKDIADLVLSVLSTPTSIT